MKNNHKPVIHAFDAQRNIVVPGGKEETLEFCVEHFINTAKSAIKERGYFNVALSGGSTPQAIFAGLASEKYLDALDWSRVKLFWSDERCVPPDDPQSNYGAAMASGMASLPIPPENIHRMRGEENPEEAAKTYEKLIEDALHGGSFDLVMLGMGDDGHTASLFPKTHGLHAVGRQVIANYVPKLNTWRITLTFSCINKARHIAVYVLGKGKAETVKHVLAPPFNSDLYPIQNVGEPGNKALWILDKDAASMLNNHHPNSGSPK